MNKLIIGIGSNVPSACDRVEECCSKLAQMFTSVKFSSIYQTKAVSVQPQPDYSNCVGVAETEQEYETIKHIFKDVEKTSGRLPQHKQQGKVIIDIDVVVWNDNIIKPKDLTRSYIKIGLKELGINPAEF